MLYENAVQKCSMTKLFKVFNVKVFQKCSMGMLLSVQWEGCSKVSMGMLFKKCSMEMLLMSVQWECSSKVFDGNAVQKCSM